jgi:hypothetical protein
VCVGANAISTASGISSVKFSGAVLRMRDSCDPSSPKPMYRRSANALALLLFTRSKASGWGGVGGIRDISGNMRRKE